MIVGLLGILKAGGAYVPIDPNYPGERIHYILKDSGCKLLITVNHQKNKIKEKFNGPVVDVLPHQEIDTPEEKNLEGIENLSSPGDTAYVIYTSGTTGYPKGCMVSHRNVVRLLINDKLPFQFDEHDVWIMAHSYCFDFSVWEMYGALLWGGKLIVPAWTNVQDINSFCTLIKIHRVTVLNQTPGAFYNFIEEEKKSREKVLAGHLRYICFGGDRLEPHYLKEWLEMYPLEKVQLVNMFGITETTVHVTYYWLKKEDILSPGHSSPIGRPLPETTLYSFDDHLNLVPIGVRGQFYVGGSGTAKGYLNKPLLTQARFFENPYKKGEVIYKTGDMGRWLADGNAEYLGRIDDQVKIRGYRIELGEIEAHLLNISKISKVVVTTLEDMDKDMCLTAYFIAEEEITGNELRSYLKEFLPDYMIPKFFIQLDRFPLTVSGKIDKQVLPRPDSINSSRSGAVYQPPGNKTETVLVGIWQEVLGLDKIGINDDFFQLGGDSLKGIRVINKIQERLGEIIHIAALFQHPTIKEFSQNLESYKKEDSGLGTDASSMGSLQEDSTEYPSKYNRETRGGKYSSIKSAEEKEYYLLSSAQKRLYILQQMEPQSTAYNMPRIIPLPEKTDIKKLEESFKKLINRHESFRTSFELIDDQPVQKIHRELDFNIQYYDTPKAPADVKIEAGDGIHPSYYSFLAQHFAHQFVHPFDLSQVPLVRVWLLKSEKSRHLLLVDMHHIITDGLSQEVLERDFEALYQGKELSPLRLQYKDFTEWQNIEKEKGYMKQQEEFWLKEFDGEIPILSLPTDYEKSQVKNFYGSAIEIILGKEELEALRELEKSESVTMYMIILALFNILLFKLSSQTCINIGSFVAGRRHVDIENIIGMFVNTLVMRNFPGGDKTFKEFLGEVKKRTLDAFANQDYPFEELVSRVTKTREELRNPPLFNVVFAFQSAREDSGQNNLPSDPTLEQAGINLQTKFDLGLTVVEYKNHLLCSFGYCKELFKKKTIQRFCEYFQQVVSTIVKNEGILLENISLSLDLREAKSNFIQGDEMGFGF